MAAVRSRYEANDFEAIIARLRKEFADPGELILPTPLGPITVGALTELKGWVYDLFSIGFPGAEQVIVNGGPVVPLANFTDEKGWILQFSAYFRNPYGTLNFVADSWQFGANPFLLNQIGGVVAPNNITIYNVVYNPFTPLGPMYGIMFAPAYPLPYERRVQITLNLPAGSPVAATTIFNASIGRIQIKDEATFIRSLKKATAEQMTGEKLNRFP